MVKPKDDAPIDAEIVEGEEYQEKEIADVEESPRITDLVGWYVALLKTRATVTDQKYGSVGYICHLVAYNEDTGDTVHSDPTFPSVVFQVSIKAKIDSGVARNGPDAWVQFRLGKQTATSGNDFYVAAKIRSEEAKDQLHTLRHEYLKAASTNSLQLANATPVLSLEGGNGGSRFEEDPPF